MQKQETHVIIVLGDQRKAISERRADKAVEVAKQLLRPGMDVNVIVTGTKTETTHISHKIIAGLERGAAPGSYRLHLDFSANSTIDNFRNSERIMRAMRMPADAQLHIVTSRFNAIRAIGIWKASNHGFELHLSEDPFGMMFVRTRIEFVSTWTGALGFGYQDNKALSKLKAMLYQGKESEQAQKNHTRPNI